MQLTFTAWTLALVAGGHLAEAASDLDLRWQALQVNCTSCIPQAIGDVSVSAATAVLDTLALDRRIRSRWLYDIGEWQLHEGGNLTQAREFIDASAHLGNANAQFMAGALSKQDDEAPGTSLLHYHFASQGGSMAATLALGYRHLLGYDGASQSCDTALRHYKVVADDVMRHNQALPNPSLPIQVFSMPDPVRFTDDQTKMPRPDSDELQSVEYLRRRALHSSNTELLVRTASLVLFTDLYQSGNVVDTLPAKREATTLLARAAELGSNVAKALLGHVRAYGLTGDEVDVQEAILLYEDALNGTAHDSFSGRSEAANGLGLIYLNGLGGHRVNIERAISLFQLSAREGHADGVYNTAKVMGFVDPEKSTQYLEASADVGHVGAIFKLARLREKQRFRGLRDGSHSCEAIVKLYKQVAEHNEYGRELLSVAAQATRSYQYKHALRLYLIAAEMGYEVAEHNAAWIMERYVLSSLREAAKDKKFFRLVQRGIKQQSPDALVRAGDLEYALQNYRRAMVHYLRAVDLDSTHPQAQYSIAYMLERGLGTVSRDRDLPRARWYYEQVQHNEPLMSYVIAFAKLKLDVELTLRAVGDSVSGVIERFLQLINGQVNDEPSGVIVFGETTRVETREASSDPMAFVPVMSFNGDSSRVMIEASRPQEARAVTVEMWLWVDASSSPPASQTLFDWQDFVRVDLVPHQDGVSWQLRVSSTQQPSSVLTLTNVALSATQWHRLTLAVDVQQNTVLLAVNDDAADTGEIFLSPGDRAIGSQKISIGNHLPRGGQNGNDRGFKGKMWGFRVRTSTSSSLLEAEDDLLSSKDDVYVVDLDYDITAHLDESTGREDDTSRLINRQGRASVTSAKDIALRMVQRPGSKK